MFFTIAGSGCSENISIKNAYKARVYMNDLISQRISSWEHAEFELIEVYYSYQRIMPKVFKPEYRKKKRSFYKDFEREV